MNKIKILFLAANPASTSQLRLDEEIRAITEKIRASEHRDSLELISAWAVRPDDLLQLLNMHRPHIVHFSGHGSQAGELLLADSGGEARPVSTRALTALFSTLKDNIRLVVLNACYSRVQGQSIGQSIDYVVGMNAAIGDTAAMVFAASFYRALGFARTVQEAFDQGLAAILLEGIPEEGTPELLIRAGADGAHKLLSLEAECGEAQLELVRQAEAFIKAGEPQRAYDLLAHVPADSPLGGKAQLLCGLACMVGSRLNRLSLADRGRLERHLKAARSQAGASLLPAVCLALLEIDYYNFHGQAGPNGVSTRELAAQLAARPLADDELAWVRLLGVSKSAKQKLGLKL